MVGVKRKNEGKKVVVEKNGKFATVGPTVWGNLFDCANLFGSEQNVGVKWKKCKPISEKNLGWPWAILQTQWKKYSQTRSVGVLLVLLSTLVSMMRLFCLSKKSFPSTLYWVKWRRRSTKIISNTASLITDKFCWLVQRAVKLYANGIIKHFIVQFAVWIRKHVSAAITFEFLASQFFLEKKANMWLSLVQQLLKHLFINEPEQNHAKILLEILKTVWNTRKLYILTYCIHMQSVTRACRTVPNCKVNSVDPAAGEVGQYEEVIRVFLQRQ